MNELDLNDFIDTSNIHHAFMHIGPVNYQWPSHILQSMPFQLTYREELASDAASVLVPRYYGFHQLAEEEIRKVVKGVCSTLSFLFNQNVSNFRLRKELDLAISVYLSLILVTLISLWKIPC